MKYAVLFLLLFVSTEVLSQSFYLRSETRNDIHVKVWVDGKLINDHIMKKGDWLEIKSNTGCWIWVKFIGDYCDDNSPGYNKNSKIQYKNTGEVWEILVPREEFSGIFFKRGIIATDGPCPKKPQA